MMSVGAVRRTSMPVSESQFGTGREPATHTTDVAWASTPSNGRQQTGISLWP